MRNIAFGPVSWFPGADVRPAGFVILNRQIPARADAGVDRYGFIVNCARPENGLFTFSARREGVLVHVSEGAGVSRPRRGL